MDRKLTSLSGIYNSDLEAFLNVLLDYPGHPVLVGSMGFESLLEAFMLSVNTPTWNRLDWSTNMAKTVP